MIAPRTLDEAERAVATLAHGWRCNGAWTLAQVLEHAAQSIDYSMKGFPSPKPAWFRATVGPLAFTIFERRGAMKHALDAAIPGAPPIARALPLEGAIAHLQCSLRAFDVWQGSLKPHFAYGPLTKARYAQAHLMHLADHWQQFVPGDSPK